MAKNTAPLMAGKPRVGRNTWLPATTANTKSDGTGTIGTDMLLLFTADATYGSMLYKALIQPQASVANTATTATVIRFYLSTVTSGATTNANTSCVGELPLPSVNADVATTATVTIQMPFGYPLEAGQTLLYSMHHAAAANTSYGVTVLAGDYINVA